MSVRIGLMGMGRIGRDVVRLLHGAGPRAAGHDGALLAAVAEVAPAEGAAYLLKYDSVRGRLGLPVRIAEGRLQVGEHVAAWLPAREAADADWAAHGVDVVIEASGRPRSRAQLAAHLERGARHVVACVPGSDGAQSFDATLVPGHNDADLAAAPRIVGLPPADAQAAVLVAAALATLAPIERLFVAAVRAYGQDQQLADVSGADMRRARAAAANIVPARDQVGDALALLLPQLAGRVSAHDLRVPVANGSMLDITAFGGAELGAPAALAALAAASARVPHVLGVCDDLIVSSDVAGDPRTAVVDRAAMMAVGGRALKVVAWYDNSWGVAHRAVELACRLAARPGGGA